MVVNPRMRRLLATGAIVVYCTAPTTSRPLLQVLANPAACAQRVEALAQAAIRIDTLSHLFRRS